MSTHWIGAGALIIGFVAAAGATGVGQTPPPAPPGAAGTPAVAPPPDGARGRAASAGVNQGGRGAPEPEPDFSPKPPILPVSPADEQKRFFLMPGYRMTPVLTEPDIVEPMQIAFDGNGRMFVLELLSYMQDADAGGELDPINRISVHEDADRDGVYEKHSVFVDKLVFPRFVLPFGPNSILTMESNVDDVYRYTDTNDDGVADKKELFTTNFGRSGNVEHQQSSLLMGMDNWLYSTYNAFRVRWTPAGVIRETTGSNGSQWGITQDNYGKIFFQGGASGLPGYFDFPVHYGNVSVPGRLEPGLEIPWGTAGVADYQGGFQMARLPDQTLARTTAGAGNDVFRGHRLPEELVGDYFYGEVTARVVRRLREVVTEGLPQLRNVYQVQHAEFIRSTDPLFRPVDQATAPDGTMYIVDAYRGIIQEGNWTRPGSYLRRKIDQYQLDKVIRRGRIWRLTSDGIEPDRTMPRMNDESAAELVAHLSHPNGWWRDTAQQLLVLKQDRSVVPALQQLARTSPSLLGRFHALWTLEGLSALDPALVREQMEDARPEMRIQALRLSEALFRVGNRALEPAIRAAVKDPDTNVVIQAMLTARFLRLADWQELVRTARAGNTARGVQLIAGQLLTPPAPARGGGATASAPDVAATLARGETIYKELCFTCHGPDGRGAPKEGAAPGATMAPSLAGSPRVQGHRDYVVRTLLHGMTGPIDGQTYTEVMIPMGTNRDEWIADVASYVRGSFGNNAGLVTPADVALARAATSSRRTSWTLPELEATIPVLINTDPSWKAGASHNNQTAIFGLNFVAWSSGAPQEPGMWFQVELPSAMTITEIQFESTTGGRGGTPTGAFSPGGGGGRGQPGAPPSVGYPRAFQVQVSIDGTRWSAPVAQGQGTGASTSIAFRPAQAKFIRITQTASDPTPWSVQRLRLYAPGGMK
jgi:mono/diheme cytochrome c family protein